MKRFHARLLGLVLSLAGGVPFSHAAPAPLEEKTWTVGDLTRKALLYAPASAATTGTPVVFVFHGHGGTHLAAARLFSCQTLWPEAIVVYMQGVKTPGKLTDPEGKKTGWQSSPGGQNDRDLKFFDTVLASLKQDYKVDDKRIYATGFSHGGYFTYLLWGCRGDVFAAVAPCAAVTNAIQATLQPKPALHMAGTGDTLVKWQWQKTTMAGVRQINGCQAEGMAWASTGTLTGIEYPSRGGTPFVALTFPGNHSVPRETPALIVRFFKEHARP